MAKRKACCIVDDTGFYVLKKNATHEAKENNAPAISDIPDEILSNIMSYCGNDLFCCEPISRRWNAILDSVLPISTTESKQARFCYLLAFRNDLEGLKKMHKLGRVKYPHMTMCKAAEAGHIEVVEWLAETFGMWYDFTVFDSAIKGGHKEMVDWLYQRPAELCLFKP